MSKTVESRVVEMRFDNRDFEKNINTSLSTLEKLTDVLRFDGVSFDKIQNGVESLERRFSTLGIVGMRVVQNLTDSVMSAGGKLTSFVTSGIVEGGKRRASNLENAHFQLQGLLKDEERVAAVMKNASDAVDGTAYGLDAAAKAASQLSASGIMEGDEMFTALRGIAGVAAMTNSEYEDVGRIFTTVAGQGRVMADQLNQMASRGLNAAAILADHLGVTEGELREMVSKGKVDFRTFSDAMDEAFGEHAKNANTTFTGAMSNVRAALSRIGADFFSPLIEQNGALVGLFNALRVRINEVRTATTPLATALSGRIATEVKGLTVLINGLNLEGLKNWLAGIAERVKSIDLYTPGVVVGSAISSLINVFSALKALLKPIGEAFREVFPEDFSSVIRSVAKGFSAFTEKLSIGEGTAAAVRTVFVGLFSVVRTLGISFLTAAQAIQSLFSGLNWFGSLAQGILSVIGNGLSRFSDFVRESGVITSVIGGIVWVFATIGEAIQNAASGVYSFLSELLGLNKVEKTASSLKAAFTEIGTTAENTKQSIWNFFASASEALAQSGFGQIVTSLFNAVKTVFGWIMDAAGAVASDVKRVFDAEGLKGVLDLLRGFLGLGLDFSKIRLFSSFTKFVDGATGIVGKIKSVLGELKESLESYQKSIRADNILKIAAAVGLLAASAFAIANLPVEKIAAAGAVIAVFMGEMLAAMGMQNKEAPENAFQVNTKALLGMAASVFVLAKAMASLAVFGSEWGTLGVAVGGISALLAEVAAIALAMNILQDKLTLSGNTSKSPTMMLLSLATAVLILANAAKTLGEIESVDKMAVAFAAVSAFVILMGEAIAKLKDSGNVGKIIGFAATIKVMASVAKDLGSIDSDALWNGVASVSALTLLMIAFAGMTNDTKISGGTAASLVTLAVAMKLLVPVIQQLGSMNAETLGQGLGYMAASLAAVALSMRIMPSGMGEIGAGLMMVSVALLAVMAAVKVIGSMGLESAAIGVVGLSVAVLALAGALKIMNGTLEGAAAMIVAAAAIAMLTPSLLMLGLMKPEMIAASLITLAGAFTVIGVAAYLLEPLVPTVLKLSLALAGFGVGLGLIGISMVAIGAGLTAIATGITALIALGSGGMLVFIGAIQSAIIAVVEMIPAVAAALANGLVAFVEVLAESAPALISAVLTLLFGLLQAIAERKLEMAEWALGFLVSVLKMLVEYTPDIVALLMQFLIGVLNAVAENLPELIEAAVNVLMAFFQGVVNALGKMDYNVLAEGLAGVGLIAAIMAALGGITLLAPAAMAGVLAVAAVVVEMAALLAAIGALAQIPGLTWLIGEGGAFLASIGEAIGGFIGGALEGVSSRLPNIGENLSAFSKNAEPFFTQAERFAQSGAAAGIAALAGAMLLLTANDLINGLTSWLTGGSSLEKFGESLAAFAPHMQTFLSYTTTFDPEAVKSSAEAVTALIGLCDKLPKSGGVAQWFGGEVNLEAFGEPLKAFGEGIKGFGDAVDGLNADAIQNVVPAGEALTDLSKTIPKDGGLMGWLNGDLNMAQFGRELYAFGNSLKNFGDAVDGLKVDAINAAVPAGKALTDLADSLPTSGGAFEWLTGSSNFTSFSEQISAFGKGLSGLSSSLVGVDPAKIEASAKAAAALSELEKALPESGGLFSGKTSLSDFGKTLATFGEGFGKYCEEIGNVNLAALDTASKATESLITISKDISSVNSDSINNFSASLENLAQAGVNGFADTLKNSDTEVANAVGKLLDGASSELGKLPDIFGGAMSGVVSLIQNTRPDFYQSGEYTVDGFITGTAAKKALAEQAGREIGEAALYGLNDSLDIHSPSEETAESGEYSVLGFNKGAVENSGIAETAGEKVGGSFMSGLMDTLGISTATEGLLDESILGNTGVGTDTAQLSGEAVGGAFTDGVTDGMNFDSVGETVSDGLDKITEAHSDAGDEQIEIVEHVTDEMIESVERRYEDERDMLEDAYDAERNALEDLHNEKLGMYKDEYMEKLRLIDEDKYNRIKAIDDEIDAIKGQTAAEKAARKEQEQREKLAELQNDVNNAKTAEERAKAEKKLADYKAELERERIEQERQNRIDELNDEKDKIEDEAKTAAEAAKEEYDTKVANENSLYEIECDNLEAQHDRRMEIIQEEYDAQKQHLEHLQKLEELQNKVRSAATDEERRKAQKELDDYRDEVARDDRKTAEDRAFSQTKDDLYRTYLDRLAELEKKRQDALSGAADENEKQKINDDYDTQKRNLKSEYDRALRYATTEYDRAVREIQNGYENSLEARQDAYDVQSAAIKDAAEQEKIANDARKQAIQNEIDAIDAEIAASKKITSQKQREAQLNDILGEINDAIAAYGTLSAQADEARQRYRDLRAKFDEEDRLQASAPALEKRRADLAAEQKTLGTSASSSQSKTSQNVSTSASSAATENSVEYIRVETGIIEAIGTAAERISDVVSDTSGKIKSSVVKAARRVSDILDFLSDEKNQTELATIAPVQQDDAWSQMSMVETALAQSVEQVRYAAAEFRTREESEFSKRALAYLGEISGNTAGCDQSEVLERIYRRLDTDAPIHVTFVMSNGAKFASGVVDGIKELNKVVGKNVLADI